MIKKQEPVKNPAQSGSAQAVTPSENNVDSKFF